jgi:hypothetical protein
MCKNIEIEPIEKEISWKEIEDSLEVTIKKDRSSKLITFCAMLLSGTEEDQINIGLQSESSTGKSYIPLEISPAFPEDRVMYIAGASPTAFFHDKGEWDKERHTITVNLEGKIIIFLDAPHFQLLEKLRPLLSHDKKELEFKITDKKEKHGLRTKNVIVRGYPTVIFCTVRMDSDQQEKTRMFLLSPEVNDSKLTESIDLLAMKLSNRQLFKDMLDINPKRLWLRKKIAHIFEQGIKEIVIPEEFKIGDLFKQKHEHLTPRHQRDFPRIISLIKAHCILNCDSREFTDKTIVAKKEDIDAGFELYQDISAANELGLPPYVWDIFNKVFNPLFEADKQKDGITKKDIDALHYKTFHKPINYTFFFKHLIPSLKAAGLVDEQRDPTDGRKQRYLPTIPEATLEQNVLFGDSVVNKDNKDKENTPLSQNNRLEDK